MDGKSLALSDLHKSMRDLESSLDHTFNGVRKEFDDVNSDLDLLFSDVKSLKKENTSLSNKMGVFMKNLNLYTDVSRDLNTRMNWLTAFMGFNTVIVLSLVFYIVLQK